MTKKDFQLIADAIRVSQPPPGVSPERAQALADVAVQAAIRLANDNPRFDRARFLAACGVQNGEG